MRFNFEWMINCFDVEGARPYIHPHRQVYEICKMSVQGIVVYMHGLLVISVLRVEIF